MSDVWVRAMQRVVSPNPRAGIVLSVWLVIGVLLLMTTRAMAQGEADKAAAEALFEQGQQLMAEGKFNEACQQFRASQQLDAGLGTLLYLADCYEKAGKLASAWATFREAESVAQTRNDAERAEIARVRSAALKPKLSLLVINAPEQRPEGYEVRRDGTLVPAASYGVAVPVDAGAVKLSVSAPGHKTQELEVSVGSAGQEPYAVTLPSLEREEPQPVTQAASAPVAAATPDFEQPPALNEPRIDSGAEGIGDEPGDQRTLGLIIGGAGVVAAIASGILTVMAAQANADSKKECPDDPNQCSAEGTRLREDALNLAGMATASGIVGAVGIGAGMAVYFTAPNAQGDAPSALGLQYGGVW